MVKKKHYDFGDPFEEELEVGLEQLLEEDMEGFFRKNQEKGAFQKKITKILDGIGKAIKVSENEELENKFNGLREEIEFFLDNPKGVDLTNCENGIDDVVRLLNATPKKHKLLDL